MVARFSGGFNGFLSAELANILNLEPVKSHGYFKLLFVKKI